MGVYTDKNKLVIITESKSFVLTTVEKIKQTRLKFSRGSVTVS